MSVTPKNGRSNSTLLEDAEKLATANLLVHQRSHSQTPNSAQSSKTKVPPVEQLINHSSDTVVKPITGNKEIEKPQDSVYNKGDLPFAAMSLDEVVAGIETPQVENHLADIYGFLGISLLYIWFY